MNYEIYSEESNVIGIYDYTVIRNKIAGNAENKISRQGKQRSVYFNQDINYLVDMSDVYKRQVYMRGASCDCTIGFMKLLAHILKPENKEPDKC